MFGFESLSAAAFADDAVDSTVDITAVTGTGSVGTAGVSHTQAVTGNTGTGSVGTVIYARALTAVTATGSVGTVGVSHSQEVTGVTGTGSVGTVVATLVEQEDSVTATGSVGTVGISVSVGLTAVSGTGSVGTVAVAHGPALTAVTATGSVGSVAMGSRTVALTGVTATGTAGTVRTWEDVNTTETANWVDVFNSTAYEDSGAFSGGAIAATTIAGNIITLFRLDLPVTWTDVTATGTTTWYPIAA